MAQKSGASPAGLSQRLLAEGYAFEFFQAVRLLELWALESTDLEERPTLVGESVMPAQEAVRFRAHPSLAFPSTEVAEIGGLTPGTTAKPGDWPVGLEVAFLGVFGPLGALPQHYTSLIIERCAAGDNTLRDFLDLFHHRAVSLFYRAWEKYHFPFLYERYRRAAQGEPQVDPLTFGLLGLVGLATDGLQRRLSIDDETPCYYSGHYAHQPRNAVALEALLADYFAADVQVVQFQGRWITLAPAERTAMPSATLPRGRNCCLGQDAIIGARVWNLPTKFRIRIGPLPYARFQKFLPGTDGHCRLSDLVRIYVGPELSFDIQVVLRREDVPCGNLQGHRAQAFRLGWNSWSRTKAYPKDADEAVFRSVDD
jgi:type VI secretion system protein ImpH